MMAEQNVRAEWRKIPPGAICTVVTVSGAAARKGHSVSPMVQITAMWSQSSV